MASKELTLEEQQIISRLCKTEYWPILKSVLQDHITKIEINAFSSDKPFDYFKGGRDTLKNLIAYFEKYNRDKTPKNV